MPDNHFVLSEREREILRLVATGAANKEIAYRLHISPNTVKVHLRNIFEKIGAASRTEAAMYAVREGIAESEAAATPLTAEMTVAAPTPRAWWRPVWAAAGLIGILAVSVAAALLARRLLATPLASTPLPSVPSPQPTPLPWQTRAPMPTARMGLAAVAYESQVLAIGGETARGLTGTVELYDPRSDQWASRAPKPLPVADVSAAVVGGRVFVPGGRMASGEITDALEIYDPRRDAWSLGTSLPVPLSQYALAAFEGKLYLFGGWNGTAYVPSVYEYDPDSNAWTQRTPLPTACGSAAAAATNGGVLVMGGCDGQRTLEANLEYIPERDASGGAPWLERAPLPEPRCGMGIASSGDLVHLLGGHSDSAGELAPLEYEVLGDDWKALPSPGIAHWQAMGFVAVGTNLIALGGESGSQIVATTLTYQALYTITIPLIR